VGKRNKQKKTVHVFFSNSEKERLEKEAEKQDKSEGAIIKDALKEYFDREKI